MLKDLARAVVRLTSPWVMGGACYQFVNWCSNRILSGVSVDVCTSEVTTAPMLQTLSFGITR